MTTAKQRAAARRNIKKAQAARRKGKKGKLCFNSIKATADALRRKGYRVVKR